MTKLQTLQRKFDKVMERHSYYVRAQSNPFRLRSYDAHLRRSADRLNKIEAQIKTHTKWNS